MMMLLLQDIGNTHGHEFELCSFCCRFVCVFYDSDFMLSLSDDNQADVIEAFNSTSRYLDDLLNNDNPYIKQMLEQIYRTELQLNKANSFDSEPRFLNLDLSITNGIVSSKIYD